MILRGTPRRALKNCKLIHASFFFNPYSAGPGYIRDSIWEIPHIGRRSYFSFQNFFSLPESYFWKMLSTLRVNKVPKKNVLPETCQKWVYYPIFRRWTILGRKKIFMCDLLTLTVRVPDISGIQYGKYHI